jgi:effector-binding domain-containing protein
MKVSIFEIGREYRDILEELEENGGEITESIADRLAINKSDFEDKCESYKVVLEHLDSNIKRRKQEVDKLEKFNKRDEKTIDYLKSYLEQAVKLYGESKVTPTGRTNYNYSFKDKDFKLVSNASESVLLASDFNNSRFMNYAIKTQLKKHQIEELKKIIPTLEVTGTPDKTAIGAALDKKEIIEGASILVKYSTKFK